MMGELLNSYDLTKVTLQARCKPCNRWQSPYMVLLPIATTIYSGRTARPATATVIM